MQLSSLLGLQLQLVALRYKLLKREISNLNTSGAAKTVPIFDGGAIAVIILDGMAIAIIRPLVSNS